MNPQRLRFLRICLANYSKIQIFEHYRVFFVFQKCSNSLCNKKIKIVFITHFSFTFKHSSLKPNKVLNQTQKTCRNLNKDEEQEKEKKISSRSAVCSLSLRFPPTFEQQFIMQGLIHRTDKRQTCVLEVCANHRQKTHQTQASRHLNEEPSLIYCGCLSKFRSCYL